MAMAATASADAAPGIGAGSSGLGQLARVAPAAARSAGVSVRPSTRPSTSTPWSCSSAHRASAITMSNAFVAP